jgi:hypothetical protein
MTALAGPPEHALPPRDEVLLVADRPERERAVPRTVLVAGTVALLLGIALRAYLVLSQPLPLNDGGLFYVMTRELQANGFRLPQVTEYNGLHIAYGYPPLGFYLAGLLDVAGLSLDGAFRLVPLVATSLTVVAFYLLARQLLSRPAEAVAATAIFAVSPRSFVWMLMGGGVTRAPGFLFALLALYEVVRFCRTNRWRHVATATLFSALTLLSHLGTAPFVAISSLLLLAAYARPPRRAVAAALLIGVGAAILSAPWWATVMLRHGLAPFQAALGSGEGIFTNGEVRHRVIGWLARFGEPLTSEPLFPLIAALGVIGALASVTRRRLVLPIWWVAILLFDARQGPTFATVPVAMLGGIAIVDVLLPALLAGDRLQNVPPSRGRRWLAAAVLAFLAIYGTAGAVSRDPDLGREQRFLYSLAPGDRIAMRWIAEHTPSNSHFLIITGGANGWSADRTSEWFPVYTGRVSVATAQGYEWVPGRDQFRSRRLAFEAFQRCAPRTVACLDSLSQAENIPFTHVYVSRLDPRVPFDCCVSLKSSLARDGRYDEVYRGADGGAVFARRDVISQGRAP